MPLTCHSLTTMHDVHELWTAGLQFTAKELSLICRFFGHVLCLRSICVCLQFSWIFLIQKIILEIFRNRAQIWIFCIRNLSTFFPQDKIIFRCPGPEIAYTLQSLNQDNPFEFIYFQQEEKQPLFNKILRNFISPGDEFHLMMNSVKEERNNDIALLKEN